MPDQSPISVQWVSVHACKAFRTELLETRLGTPSARGACCAGHRYVLLYLYGGIYLDLDIECTKPLDFLRAYPFVMPATRPVGFSNDFLAAAPQHAFLARLLRTLPACNLWLLTKYPTVMFSTGPMFLTLQARLLLPGGYWPTLTLSCLIPSESTFHHICLQSLPPQAVQNTSFAPAF